MFNKKRAYQYLLKQTRFGPRPPGTEAHLKLRTFLTACFKRACPQYFSQPFQIDFQGRTLSCENIIGQFWGTDPQKTILIGSHFDTRWVADREVEIARRNQPIIGANDGGSGIAVILEFLRLFKKNPPRQNILLVGFDAEDLGNIDGKPFSIGATYFAENFHAVKVDEVIILDMVGGNDMLLSLDQNSWLLSESRRMLREIYQIGVSHQFREFDSNQVFQIGCDHIPFIEKGIPAIILIDITYSHWHTLNDIPENCSAHSLGVIGTVLSEYINGEGTIRKERARHD